MSAHTIVDLTQSIKTYTDRGDSAQEALIKNTVGWTGKNQAISQDNNSVIGSVQNGKKYIISFDGTATATIKKNSSSGTAVVTDEESPIEITADADYDVYFAASAAVTNIMLRDAAIKDSSFEPHHKTVDECKLEITYGTTDIGEGAPLADNMLYAVVEV